MCILLNVILLLKIFQWQPMSYRIEQLTPEYGIQAPSLSSPWNTFACHVDMVFSCHTLSSLPPWRAFRRHTSASDDVCSLCIPQNLLFICPTEFYVTSDAPLHVFPLAPFRLL